MISVKGEMNGLRSEFFRFYLDLSDKKVAPDDNDTKERLAFIYPDVLGGVDLSGEP